MGRPAGWMKELTGRAPMKSPGKPSLRRDVERLFWREIAKGLSSEEAALGCGCVSGGRQPVVSGAWRDANVHARSSLGPVSVFRGAGGDRAVEGAGCRGSGDRPAGRALAVDDLEGAASQRGHSRWKARLPRVGRAVEGGADGPAPEDREDSPTTTGCASTCRSGSRGQVRRPDGTAVPGPAAAPWKGRNKPRPPGPQVGRLRGARSRSLTG